jgi:HTH-type transcriptional regulator/antitoxin HigA
MKLRPIKNNKQYEAMLEWVDTMLDKKVKPNTPEGEKVQIALLLIKSFEDEHHAIAFPNTLAAIKYKMSEKGLKNKDLVELIGSKGYVSSLLSGKKPLTLEIAKVFHKKLGIPAEILLA